MLVRSSVRFKWKCKLTHRAPDLSLDSVAYAEVYNNIYDCIQTASLESFETSLDIEETESFCEQVTTHLSGDLQSRRSTKANNFSGTQNVETEPFANMILATLPSSPRN